MTDGPDPLSDEVVAPVIERFAPTWLIISAGYDAHRNDPLAGLQLTSAFYWDRDDTTRAWSKRFADRNNGNQPTMVQAGVYSAVLGYLRAVEALGSDGDGKAVVDQLEKMGTDDPIFGKSTIRSDGRHVHNMYLFEVKKPDESKGKWDYYKLVREIPAAEAFRPLADGGCQM